MQIPASMKAAVLGDPGRIEVVDLPVPDPGPEDVLVRVHRASLCGTDVKILDRTFFKDGGPEPGTFVPGHEYAGTVVGVGESVDELWVGDRVVSEAHRGCMRCRACLGGHYTDCLNYGVHAKGHRAQGMTVNGGFAEYVRNHVSTLHRLPDGVGFESGVVLSTVGTVMHAFDVLGELVTGARVVVIGPGPIGLLAVQVARELSAAHIALVGTRESRLAHGRAFGADVTLAPGGGGGAAAALLGSADVVLECSGSGGGVDDALRYARRGGRVVLVGFFDRPVTTDLNHAVVNGISLLSVRGEGTGSLERAVALAARGRLDLDALVTHRVPLTSIAEAFEIYIGRRDDALKVMLEVRTDDGPADG